jgi:glycosyltransferase involved in cell wall biosynthesis
MMQPRKMFSICIPAYNRARHLTALLDSIFSQNFSDYEVVICEDRSPERELIAATIRDYQDRYPGKIRYYENPENLGYDGNIRTLVERAEGCFCFFMGNDDVMCPDAMEDAASAIKRHPNVGLVMKSYGLFDETPEKVNQVIRWFKEETELPAGETSIRFAFRRSGVISGYIVDRDSAQAVATNKFDGTLYYQMHLTANVLINKTAVCTPSVLILCRGNEPPQFGNSEKEKGKYVPGRYTPEARLNMVGGALSIIRDLRDTRGIDVVDDVIHDYANYFYPYIKDQLNLPIGAFYRLYRGYGRMGFRKYALFHLYFVLGFILGEKRFDALTAIVRKKLGRSPRLGKL